MDKKRHNFSIVFGGAGFIGSHLCRRLLGRGDEVLCVDNMSTGRFENIHPMLRQYGFRFLYHDVAVPIPESVSGIERVDNIYNLACAASPVYYQVDSVHTLATSVVGSLNILNLARSKGAKVLLASTSEVYGDPQVSPQSEDYWGNVNPNGVRSCYDEGKRAAETLFCDFHRMYGTDTRIVRIFNTYGPCMSPEDGRVVPTFINQALAGEPLTVNGDGSQTRSLMYIDDLIDGIMRVMDAPIPAMPVNLGNPEEMTVNELASLIVGLTGSTSTVVHRPLPPDDPRRRCPDISLAKRILDGWYPKIPLAEGLKKTIQSFRK